MALVKRFRLVLEHHTKLIGLENMLGKRFLVRVILRGIFCSLIAAFVLSFLAKCLLPPILVDPINKEAIATDLLWIGIWLISIGIGIYEGFWSWKKYDKNEAFPRMMDNNSTSKTKWLVVIFQTFKTNSRGFWKAYRGLIILFIVSLIADGASTIYFMLRIGPQAEIHPAIHFVSKLQVLGPIAGPTVSVVAKAVAGITVGIYWRRFAAYVFIAATVISFWAAWYNLAYTP